MSAGPERDASAAAARKRRSAADFDACFAALRSILLPYAEELAVVKDGPAELSLDTRHAMPNGKPLCFAAVRRSKSYVSFHLMPVYVFPDILGTPFVSIPTVNHDNNQHAENENLRLGNLFRGIEILAAVAAAQLPPPARRPSTP